MPQIGPLKIKVQLYRGAERAFGPGRAELLESIDREGSISAAGRSLGMSYRYAWLLVDSMNRCFSEKLVEAATGGHRGGGARLSEVGRKVLSAYRALEADVARSADGLPLSTLEVLLGSGAGGRRGELTRRSKRVASPVSPSPPDRG